MKKIITAVLCICMCVSLCACGGSEPKNIGGTVENLQTGTETQTSVSSDKNSSSSVAADAYSFTFKGVRFTADMDCAEVVAKLGDPASYYEAPSCAFDGMEKTYTYSSFEIGTYEDGKTDRIAMILFLNDLVATEEGVAVGDSVTKVESLYSNPTESSDRLRTYVKGGVQLIFFIDDGKVSSIEYLSMKGND